ncbi:MAG: carbohydrate kinase [Roseivirga sp.]|uniref:xylulokinase n=1 Tax=Roseivirga sp. TaxID=1964215 RepID=UPI001B282A24|nr:FGGY family carbohydrate kinase [Roseivirga sp.]MBO6662634.1 carbohydrate kinase [Roseivirga sp.]MBO6761360.1 carbohydrate kinase [Roseivirga sp.]MBO6909641.1 carbohydrate kinase [Roseivirga sp.]
MFWIGYDIGSSSIKASLVDADTGKVHKTVQYPEQEMVIHSPKNGWAEQDPESWWFNLCQATKKLLKESEVSGTSIKGLGISYQMHGLVLVDKQMEVLRPSIIWCDSRAVKTGNELLQACGEERSINSLLNSPGNFTLSKLKWVKDNEPETFERVHKFMLPGDFIALKLTGTCSTTISGLSEGIVWDFKEEMPANWLLEVAGIDRSLVSELVDTFSEQGKLSEQAAKATGLPMGIPLMYRAGDQPNNAMALNVMQPGEIAATGGTSGVVYAITDQATTKEGERINCFAHVNHGKAEKRIGKMLCINGTGIQYSWMRKQVAANSSYQELNAMAESIGIGSEGLRILPFGNGAERMLYNENRGARVLNLNFNLHTKQHLLRASLEGIAFSFVYGLEILKEDGVALSSIKAGNDNLFQSSLFSNTISTLTGTSIKIMETTGAVGAARAAATAFGDFSSLEESVQTDKQCGVYEPLANEQEYLEPYHLWKRDLNEYIN